MDKNRKYMIATKRHEGLIREALLFWGYLTEDNEERSFGGYTVDINKCEKYTREELEQYRKTECYDEKDMLFLDETEKPWWQLKNYDLLVTMEDLEKIGYRKFTVMVE